MRVTQPTSLADITIKQYQEYIAFLENEPSENELIDGLLRIFCGLNNVDHIIQKDRVELFNGIKEALTKVDVFDKKPFRFNGSVYGMIPNFDRITKLEYVNMMEFCNEEESIYKLSNFKAETLHLLMAILFREVDKKYKNDYSLVGYKETEEEANVMLDLPMSKVVGIESFFLTLWQDLDIYTLRSMEEEQARGM